MSLLKPSSSVTNTLRAGVVYGLFSLGMGVQQSKSAKQASSVAKRVWYRSDECVQCLA